VPLVIRFFINGPLTGLAIPGATDPTLALPNLSAADAGLFTVTVSNAIGTVTSRNVSMTLIGLVKFAGLTISGPVGAQYSIQSTSTLQPPNWTTRTNITLAAPTYIYIDYSSPANPSQFYRAVPLYP
jgi:hypothetical protein